jgi:hypothetical protein
MKRCLSLPASPNVQTMTSPRHPSLYQINTRVWLTELSRNLNRPAALDNIADAKLDRSWSVGIADIGRVISAGAGSSVWVEKIVRGCAL